MDTTTKQLLSLTEQSYDNYNVILPKIKETLSDPERLEAFERVLAQELPFTTARRAYRTAIRIAMGEENVYREWRPANMLAQRFAKR